jgi:hypothetical protein
LRWASGTTRTAATSAASAVFHQDTAGCKPKEQSIFLLPDTLCE